MIIDLSHQNLLVTGASSGIGRAICIAAAQAGANIYAAARHTDRLAETLSLLPSNGGQIHQAIAADLTQENDLSQLIAALPPLNGVVHAAGIVKPLPVKYIVPKHIDEVFGINYKAAVCLTAQLFKRQKIADGASLVFISSISSQHPYMGGALYVSTKAALEAFCRTVALEYAAKRIRANCLLPGLVQTSILEQTRLSMSPEQFAAIEQHYPLGLGKPQDIANAALFFLSDAARWITGTTLVMDGGLTLSSK